ncbi:Serpentine receptor class r-10 [Caenorhabditis elegans]|uniref:Serpentine receptor class r-10 n=1 Tax=Caenorhabditis elegans TaxID=6239 RepID=Q9N2T6_CAEEL|nr:Seven TM Receptor [Caenorhabditis elegans]CCD68695.1 Seven TM Receptor [Caenorhabditis elegans]|eukprot:NP_500673.2 Seven TM Receptor [Caenorhabditis elegans]
MGKFSLIKLITQPIAAVLSVLVNSVLILLVITNSPRKMGSYKYLLIYFSALTIVYAALDFVAAPYMFNDESTGVVLVDLRNNLLKDHPDILMFNFVSGVACFGSSLYAIAINFIYRYFAVQREGRLRYFSGFRLVFWILLSILCGIMTGFMFYAIGSRQEISQGLRENLETMYDLDINQTIYYVFLYWQPNDGSQYFTARDIMANMGITILMMIPILLIVFFGTKTYRKVKNLTTHGKSEYSKRLQMQLYKALVAQIIIPSVFLFLPTLLIAAGPLFKLNIPWASLPLSILFSIFSVMDSIRIIFLVDEYRNALFEFFGGFCCVNEVVPASARDTSSDQLGGIL